MNINIEIKEGDSMEYVSYFILGMLALVILAVVLSASIKFIIKLVINGVLGVILLLLVNFIGASFSFHIGINAITALIAGFFGIPGVIFLIIFKILL